VGFEPTTFTQKCAMLFLAGFSMTAPEIRNSPRGVSKPVCACFLEPVVIPTFIGLSDLLGVVVLFIFLTL
jgi:hypothetical protein